MAPLTSKTLRVLLVSNMMLFTGCPTDSLILPAIPWTLHDEGLGAYCTSGSDPDACELAHCIQLDVDREASKLVFTNICEEILYIPLTYAFIGGERCSDGNYIEDCNAPMWMKTDDGVQWGNSGTFAPWLNGHHPSPPPEEIYLDWLVFDPERPLFLHMASQIEQCAREERDVIGFKFALSCSEEGAPSFGIDEDIIVSYDLLLPLPQRGTNLEGRFDPVCSSSCETRTPSCASEPGFIYIEDVHAYRFGDAFLECERVQPGFNYYF